MFVGFFMMSRPKFRQHPYKIMYWACLMEAMWYFVTSMALLECNQPTLTLGGWQLALTEKVFGYYNLVEEDNSSLSQFTYFFRLVALWSTCIFAFAIMSSIYLNTILFADLYLSIKNPFVARGSRVKYYYTGMALSFLVYITAFILYPPKTDTANYRLAVTSVQTYYALAFCMVTVCSGFLVTFHLCKKRTSA